MLPDALMDQELTAGRFTLRRVLAIEQGRGAPPSKRERAALARVYASPFAAHAERVVGAALAHRNRLRGLTARRAPVVHVRREPETRPQKRRARSRSTAPTRGPPDEPGELPQRLTADERRALKIKIDARRREVVRATKKVEHSLERHWRESAA
jgi:hypothetical protein